MKKIVISLNESCIEVVESSHPDWPTHHFIGRSSSTLQDLINSWTRNGFSVEILPLDEKRKKLEEEVDMFIKSHKNLDEFKEILKEVSGKYFEEMSHKDDATPTIKWNHVGSSKPIFEKISKDVYKASTEALRIAITMLFSQTNFDEKKIIKKVQIGRFNKELGAVIILKDIDDVIESKPDIWKRIKDAVIEYRETHLIDFKPKVLVLTDKDYKELHTHYKNSFQTDINQRLKLTQIDVIGYTLKIQVNQFPINISRSFVSNWDVGSGNELTYLK